MRAAIPLHGRIGLRWDREPFVVRVSNELGGEGPSVARVTESRDRLVLPDESQIDLPAELDHLQAGDVLRINPRRGEIWVMYRRASGTNSILLTERCNSWCVMCSQPPKVVNEDGLVQAWLDAIPLMSPETMALGITGGEPTLLGDQFFGLVQACRDSLPATALHVLSNGRTCNYLSFCQELRQVVPDDFMMGIPLYSDVAWQHDFVVQSRSAFDQTIRGILNLARCEIATEIRVVIHRHTVSRLASLAEFICRNLPFVQHVALMGLEPIGFGRTNLDALWIDPLDYVDKLHSAVRTLNDQGMNVSIYNHQLCILPEELWSFARQSISDWKNIFLPKCSDCSVRDQCGGFFHSAELVHSRGIRPLNRPVAVSPSFN